MEITQHTKVQGDFTAGHLAWLKSRFKNRGTWTKKVLIPAHFPAVKSVTTGQQTRTAVVESSGGSAIRIYGE